jgi:hypothetical protein
MPKPQVWRSAVRWSSRPLAVATGIGLLVGGINFAADLGDILLAVPMLVLGGLQLLDAIAGHASRPLAFELAAAGGLLIGGLNFVGDIGGSVFALPLVMLGGLQLLHAAMTRGLRQSVFVRRRAAPPKGRWN